MKNNLKDLIFAFESAVRAHENLGSQPVEDHAIIEEEYARAKDDLLGALEEPANNPAAAVVAYIMDGENVNDNDDAMEFLHYWNEGEFDILRRNWKNIPDEVFVGAEVDFMTTQESEE